MLLKHHFARNKGEQTATSISERQQQRDGRSFARSGQIQFFVPGFDRAEFALPRSPKPTTVRFDVVNLFDKIYAIRDGSGVGVFAPQFGPRRGFYVGITQEL